MEENTSIKSWLQQNKLTVAAWAVIGVVCLYGVYKFVKSGVPALGTTQPKPNAEVKSDAVKPTPTDQPSYKKYVAVKNTGTIVPAGSQMAVRAIAAGTQVTGIPATIKVQAQCITFPCPQVDRGVLQTKEYGIVKIEDFKLTNS